MSREVHAVRGTPLTSEWINRMQEAWSLAAWGVTLVKLDANTVAVQPVDDGEEERAGLWIAGHARWISSDVTLTVSGAAGTRSVYAVAQDLPATGFTLSMASGAGRRKIAEVDWDGSAITAIRNLVDAVSGHGHLHRPGGPDPLPAAWGAGKAIIPDEESRTNTAYGTLPTPDVVENVVLPTDGLLFIAAAALWKESAGDVARAALFIGANQLKVSRMDAADPKKQAASMTRGGTTTNVGYRHLTTCPIGLTSQYIAADLDAADVSTGVALGLMSTDTIGPDTVNDTDDAQMAMSPHLAGGVCVVRAPAGTYDVSVQYKATSGTVTAKSRKLWVWTQGFPA